jgi:hypothetical protein
MTDHDLTDLLDRLGERTPVGAPPTGAMLGDAARLRRRRTAWVAAGAAAAVAVVVGGLAAVTRGSDLGGEPDGPPVSQPTTFVPPEGTRLVGIGHLAIAVPEGWGTNALACGTPKRDTVIIDQGAVCLADFPRKADIESVHVYPGWYGGFGTRGETATEQVEVAGEPAEQVPTTCGPEQDDVRVCRGAVYFPDEDVTFLADSSSADAREQVAEVLSWIHVVPGLVAVPGYQASDLDFQDDDAGEHYRAGLAALGLEARTITEKHPGTKAGFVLGVQPRPGTMVAAGATVTVTEVAEPEGPADEINVDLNSVGPGDSMDYRGLSDEQIRAGATIRIDLGARIWVYAFGKRVSTLAGEIDGSSLVLDDWTEGPNYGRSWRAVERGTSTITVTITADGRRIEIGTVTVVVVE